MFRLFLVFLFLSHSYKCIHMRKNFFRLPYLVMEFAGPKEVCDQFGQIGLQKGSGPFALLPGCLFPHTCNNGGCQGSSKVLTELHVEITDLVVA